NGEANGAKRDLQHDIATIADAVGDLAEDRDRLGRAAVGIAGMQVSDRGARRRAPYDFVGDLLRRDRQRGIIPLRAPRPIGRDHDHHGLRRAHVWLAAGAGAVPCSGWFRSQAASVARIPPLSARSRRIGGIAGNSARVPRVRLRVTPVEKSTSISSPMCANSVAPRQPVSTGSPSPTARRRGLYGIDSHRTLMRSAVIAMKPCTWVLPQAKSRPAMTKSPGLTRWTNSRSIPSNRCGMSSLGSVTRWIANRNAITPSSSGT